MGTSSDSIQQGSERQDHPHTCGDKKGVLLGYLQLPGSSPHVWGQGNSYCRCSRLCGIIPTRVGTSPIDSRGNAFIEDHPHACGDKSRESLRLCLKRGSSPRVWGQGQVLMWLTYPYGIIPTRVGTSLL